MCIRMKWNTGKDYRVSIYIRNYDGVNFGYYACFNRDVLGRNDGIYWTMES